MIREAIILVGGQGTRLRPLVSDRPKPMALVSGRPFLEWLLLALRAQGVRKVVLAAGHMAEMVREHFKATNIGVEVCVVCEANPLGTAGAARNAALRLDSEFVAVLNGDSYCSFSLSRLAWAQQRSGADACLWLVPVEDSGRFGAVRMDAENRIVAFEEKGLAIGAGLINAGIYVMSRKVLLDLPADRTVSMEREVLPGLIAKRTLSGVVGAGPFSDIGTPESYQTVADELGDVLLELAEDG